MAVWTRINGGSATSGGTNATSLSYTTAWSVTAGNLLAVVVGEIPPGASSAIPSIGDTLNSYVAVGNTSISTNRFIAAATSKVATGGTLTITATISVSALISMTIDEFSCAGAIGSPESVVTMANTSTASPSPGSITPTGTDLLCAAYSGSGQNSNTAIVNGPFVVSSGQVNNNSFCDIAVAFAVDQTTAQTPTFTVLNRAVVAIGFGVKATLAGASFRRTMFLRGGSRGGMV